MAIIIITLVLSLTFSGSILAAGDEEPAPTVEPTAVPEEEAGQEEQPEESKGGISVNGSPQYGGEPVYGGGVISPREGDFLVDKAVKNPATDEFVDHLGPTDPKYRPLDIVVFQIKVNNPGTQDIAAIEAVDSLPEFIDFMTGPGEFDPDSRKLTFTVEGLSAGETKEFEIKARVSHESLLPEEKSVLCPVNVVDASFADKTDHDESQFCLEKEMVIPQVPEAGTPGLILPLLGSVFSAGLFLRKKISL